MNRRSFLALPLVSWFASKFEEKGIPATAHDWSQWKCTDWSQLKPGQTFIVNWKVKINGRTEKPQPA